MARHVIIFSNCICLQLLMLVGCSSDHTVAQTIPPPSFSGPTVAANPVPAPTLPPKQQVSPKPTKTASAIPRAWTPAASPRAWKWIVIHHSATPAGSAKSFDRMHREKGWDELGYHFVIGNGTESGDGQVEVGQRWTKQKWGAHAKTADNLYNDYGIGICLVGNFDIEKPTPAQMRALAKLTAYLMQTYKVPPSRVLGHSDTKPTDCPGRNMSIATVRRMASSMVADASGALPDDEPQPASAIELVHSSTDDANR